MMQNARYAANLTRTCTLKKLRGDLSATNAEMKLRFRNSKSRNGYHIKEIAFDRWGAVQMVQNLEGMGFTVVPFGQGFKDMSRKTSMPMLW